MALDNNKKKYWVLIRTMAKIDSHKKKTKYSISLKWLKATKIIINSVR